MEAEGVAVGVADISLGVASFFTVALGGKREYWGTFKSILYLFNAIYFDFKRFLTPGRFPNELQHFP